MPTGLTRRDVDALYKPLRDTHAFLTARRDVEHPKSSIAGSAVAAAEVGLGALGLGYYYGKTQQQTLGKTSIPTGLAVGAGGLLLSLFAPRALKPYASHLQNLSNGAIASWLTMVGAGYGQGQANKATTPTASSGLIGCGGARAAMPQLTAGAPRYGQRPAPLTEAEYAALGRQIR